MELRRIVASPRARRGLETMGALGATAAVLPELEALRGVEQSRFHHLDVYGLGDLDRATLYAAIAIVAIVLAGWGNLFDHTAGTIAAIALLALSGAGLMRVYRNWQRY